jgi:glycosyltransferase involved in cell wall biosynthesis
LKKSRIIFDVHENFYGWILEKEWLPKYSRTIFAFVYVFIEKIILRFTDMIWYAVPEIGENYNRYRKLPKLYVPNWPPKGLFESVGSNNYFAENQFVFIGSMDADRSIIQIVRAFKIFVKKNPNYFLSLIGPFYSKQYQKKVKNIVHELNLESKVNVLGKMPFNEALMIVQKSKVGFSLHQPTYNYLHGMPLKLFEYMGMSVPVIASNFNNFEKIVTMGRCGICVDPNNITEISRAMQTLISDEKKRREMGENGKDLIFKKLNWEKIEPNLFKAVHELCSSGN